MLNNISVLKVSLYFCSPVVQGCSLTLFVLWGSTKLGGRIKIILNKQWLPWLPNDVKMFSDSEI